MPSDLADHLRALGDVADLLEDAGVRVEDIKHASAHRATDTDLMRAELRLDIPADVDLPERDGGGEAPTRGGETATDDPSAEEDTATDDPAASEDSPPEDKGDDTGEGSDESPPETRCEGEDASDDGRRDYDGLSDLQRDVVDALAEHGELQTTKLRSVSGAGHSVYEVLTVLDEDGWIDRRDDPDDGRRTLVSLTDAAADLVDGDGTDCESADDRDESDGDADQDESDADGGDGGDSPDSEDGSDGIDWLDLPPEEIVADSPASRTLNEVVTEVERADHLVEMGQRLALTPNTLRGLLADLGLSRECDDVDGEDDIDERLAQLRDYADSEVTA